METIEENAFKSFRKKWRRNGKKVDGNWRGIRRKQAGWSRSESNLCRGLTEVEKGCLPLSSERPDDDDDPR